MRLRGAYLSMHRSFNAHCAQFGATADQYVVLTVLSEEDGITQQELVRRIYSDQNTVAAMVSLLEKRGLIRRRTHPSDGRAWRVHLTPKGRSLQEKIDWSAERLHQQLREALLPEEKDSVLNSLKRIADAMAPPDGKSWAVARRRAKASGQSKALRTQPAKG